MLTSWLDAVRAGVASGAVIVRPVSGFRGQTEAVVEQFYGIKRAACVGHSTAEAVAALAAELERVRPWVPPVAEPTSALEVTDPADEA